MSRFSYLAEKILMSDFLDVPFKHLYIDNFFNEEDFTSIIACPEIATPTVETDEQLISELRSLGYEIIAFPGCITNVDEYIKWHSNKKSSVKFHTACEGFGMVLRLYEKKSQILSDLEEFLLSDEFNSAIADKFGLTMSSCKIDGGIQKYLDGYEISPHPDGRRKAATYMVNINPSKDSETADHHTHYLKFKKSKQYIYDFWANNPKYDRDWVPWDWCETVKQQNKNNSIVIFSPSNDTLHAVKTNYDHFKTQRTQLYGNLWYLESKTEFVFWEQLQIPFATKPDRKAGNIDIADSTFGSKLITKLPPTLKTIIKKLRPKSAHKTGVTNMDRN